MELGPIYIGGLDRSGKTTMRAFLASHPNIAIPAVGSNMWTYFYGQFGDLNQPQNFERCLDALLRYKHVRFLQPDPDRIRREFWSGPHTYAHLFSLFLIHFAEREGKARWGAQTRLIERYADELFAAYPGLKVIHMVRDPRDRYEASLARWPEGKGRAGGATARWLYSTSLAERNAQRYPDHYKIVRFESLVRAPEEILRDVCSFLGEPFVPEILAMPGALKHRDRLVGDRDLPPEACPLSVQFIGQFRTKVPAREIAFMQMFAGRRMQAYGYALEPLHFSKTERAAFFLVTLPNHWLRMAVWRTMESLQQNFAQVVGRKPGERMIVEDAVAEAGAA
ncbi:MAG TPA: sulfotransferase [Candidatus Binatia bacterium]|nr:sulfotransferase [Candidatus Binatia bacterium]